MTQILIPTPTGQRVVVRQSRFLFSTRSAVFSRCALYRYLLAIAWDNSLPIVNFLLLNPSTADQLANDPTVERCERRAREGGFGALTVTNLFAYRATDPRTMLDADDPVGSENDGCILASAKGAKLVICGWGTHGAHLDRGKQVAEMLRSNGIKLHALKLTADGHPGHPLYLGYDLRPVVWE